MNALRRPRDRVPGAGQADEVLAEGIQPRPQPFRGVAAQVGGDEDDPEVFALLLPIWPAWTRSCLT
jgi:hypothetical protein